MSGEKSKRTSDPELPNSTKYSLDIDVARLTTIICGIVCAL
jgi:hypothetical protein